MSIEDFCVHRVDVALQANLIDATGGVARDPRAVVRSNVACLVQPKAGGLDANQGRAGQTLTHAVHFPAPQGLDRRHALLWGDRVLMVLAEADHNGMGEHVVVRCEEVVT